MIRRLGLVTLLLGALALAACGGDGPTVRSRPGAPTETPVTVSPTPMSTVAPDPPTELRVAFINLAAPLPLDAGDAVLDETFDERLELIVAELKQFDPDIVGFNEASVTNAHGSVRARLSKELNMETVYARANPWYPGQSKEQSEELAKQIGFEEGELFLIRSDRFPIVKVEPLDSGLNPRTSESGERRTALHVVLKGPGALGDLDFYITHLTGGGDRVRAAQAQNFVDWIDRTKGPGWTIVMGGMSDPVGSSTYSVYEAAGFKDVTGGRFKTCCRLGVLGDQMPPEAQTDYLMTDGWQPTEVKSWGDSPHARPDGTMLYPSDHNGLLATFSLEDLQRELPP